VALATGNGGTTKVEAAMADQLLAERDDTDDRDKLEARARYWRDECLRARAKVAELEQALKEQSK
jgi:hypothetical protein